MEVKTFTYKKMLNTFYLQRMFGNKKMDDHIAEMARDGWEMFNSANHKGPSKGIGLSGETIGWRADRAPHAFTNRPI